MLNPATQPTPDLNDFTKYIRDNPGTIVKIRNGYLVQPKFYEAEDEHCSDGFHDSHHRWYTNGRSIISTSFDMMEIKSDD